LQLEINRRVKQFFQIVLLVICVAVFWYIFDKKHASTTIINRIDTVFINKTDTIYKTAYIPKYNEITIRDTVEINVYDTVFIVQDYKEIRVYQDTIRDSSFIVFLTDTITQNKIISRSYYGQVFSNETIISKELVVQNKRQFCAGITLLYEYNNRVIPGILIGTQKNNVGTHLIYNPNFIGVQSLWHF